MFTSASEMGVWATSSLKSQGKRKGASEESSDWAENVFKGMKFILDKEFQSLNTKVIQRVWTDVNPQTFLETIKWRDAACRTHAGSSRGDFSGEDLQSFLLLVVDGHPDHRLPGFLQEEKILEICFNHAENEPERKSNVLSRHNKMVFFSHSYCSHFVLFWNIFYE